MTSRKRSAADQDVMLEAIERTGANLTVWEETFIESLRTQLGFGRSLSAKQLQVLERIYTEKAS